MNKVLSKSTAEKEYKIRRFNADGTPYRVGYFRGANTYTFKDAIIKYICVSENITEHFDTYMQTMCYHIVRITGLHDVDLKQCANSLPLAGVETVANYINRREKLSSQVALNQENRQALYIRGLGAVYYNSKDAVLKYVLKAEDKKQSRWYVVYRIQREKNGYEEVRVKDIIKKLWLSI